MRITLLTVIALVSLSILKPALADEPINIFDVESNHYAQPNQQVLNALKTINGGKLVECGFKLRKAAIASPETIKSYFFVTVKSGKCIGSSAAPMLVIEQIGDDAHVILSGVAMHIEALNQSNNGLKNLKLSGGNAGHAFVEYWAYDGQAYQPKENQP